MPTFDRFSKDYAAVLDQCVSFAGEGGSAYFAEGKARHLERVLPSVPARVLDYGCGVGLLAKSVLDRFPAARLDGYDISADTIVNVDPGLARRARFTSDIGSLRSDYDAILVSNVLHHVPEDRRTALLSALRDRLAPRGKLVVFEHNPANPLTLRIVRQCPFDHDAVLLPSRETLRRLSDAGLRSERLDYITFIPGLLARLQPAERWLGWCPLGAQYAATAGKGD